MAPVVSARHHDPREVGRLSESVAAACPGYGVSAGTWEGQGELTTPAGARYLWPIDGSGEVFLAAGYRTQEGDGEALPSAYVAEPLPTAGPHLAALRAALAGGAIHAQLRAPVAAVCARAAGAAGAAEPTDGTYRGDIRGEIWLLLESGVDPRVWASTAEARLALRWFVRHFGELGWSTKQAGGWERLLPGDQLMATPACPLRVRGRFRFWAIEDASGAPAPGSSVRRLRHLRDTAGGCSPGFDAFRRLNLTWHPAVAQQQRVAAALAEPESQHPAPASDAHVDGERPQPGLVEPDAPNRLNSHVLHIEAAQSRTHYHPEPPVGGGTAQHEFYFVLDPAAYGLHAPAGAVPRLYTFPDVHDWRRHEVTDLTPGLAAYIPPGTGHRGVDAFVNVVTIPGFKPRNEIYVDSDIRDRAAGAPFNAVAAGF